MLDIMNKSVPLVETKNKFLVNGTDFYMSIRITTDMLQSPSLKDIEMIREVLPVMELEYWLQYSLFTWQWWFLLASTILPWIIWWKKVDRSRFFDITTFGLWWVVVAVTLDNMGVTLHLWDYPIQLIYLMPPLVPADLAVIPITYMFLYQYIQSWGKFIIASIIAAFTFSYIIEPFFVKFEMLKFYESTFEWGHTVSFFSFTLLSILVRWFHLMIIKMVVNDHNIYGDH